MKPPKAITKIDRYLRRIPSRSLAWATLALVGSVQAIPSSAVSFGAYVSHQVNVDASGDNISGDKGNEPTIAVSPLNPANIVIGWRRFDPQSYTVKRAGYAYSFDGGTNWSNGTLPSSEGQDRTDPALDVDADGNFYYQSMAVGSVNATSVFTSVDGGITWSDPVYQFIGDKNWIAVDKTDGVSRGHIYSMWRRSGFGLPDPQYVPKYFIRSTDGGIRYQEPDVALPVPLFGFGRIAIDPIGTVYLSGIDETVVSSNALGIVRGGYYVLKSDNAKDPLSSPSFTAQRVDLGGNVLSFFATSVPNPLGGHGDIQIATDQSSSPMRGNVYVMAHVNPTDPQRADDPLDLHFASSSDGGVTWSAPIRVNDDAASAYAYQWFPMLGVAPNARIDAVWYDTRNGAGSTQYRQSQLYYAYSWDGGRTWSRNQPITPAFDTHRPYNVVNGEERQADKLGDYTQLISDANGAHVAYAATYSGEQDIYYLNVFPDCDVNAISDVLDIAQRRSGDTNRNHLPDVCEEIVVTGDLDGDRDVDQHDLTRLLAARNQPALGPDDPRDLDDNGVINALDARRLTQLCTRLRCAVG